MSNRVRIRDALVDKLKEELIPANSDKYYNDIDNQVFSKNLYLDQIELFPAICVALGPERVEYQPSGFRWNYPTMYIRLFVRSEDSADENLELLIQDIKTFIDTFENMHYTMTKPDGESTTRQVTQMTLLDIDTDEGLLAPHGICEMRVELRYSDRNARM